MGFGIKLPRISIGSAIAPVASIVNANPGLGIKGSTVDPIGSMYQRNLGPLIDPSMRKQPSAMPGMPGDDELLRKEAIYHAGRLRDLQEGRDRGAEIFKDGVLGRMSEGYSPEEQNAMRSENLAEFNRGVGADARQQRIMLAANGVRGARAAALMKGSSDTAANARAAMERDLFLKNVDAKREAQKYNQEQAAKELQGRLTTEMGYGALGSADRGAAGQAIVGAQQAAAAARAGGSKGKK